MRFPITIKIADHCSIYYSGKKPPHLTTVSDKLYQQLTMPHARRYLQQCKGTYGQDWGYNEPEVIQGHVTIS